MADTTALRSRLLRWYRAHRRDLPWRTTRDPYAIWISEIMLQQTRVDTVIPYFERFLERWPTVSELASAEPDQVRSAWSGLGYYRRAKLMMDAAAMVVRDHGGRLPDTNEALRRLPGFGRYTAGAVASIAFDQRVPAVDTNVTRVLSRVLGLRARIAGQHEQRIWAFAAKLAAGAHPGDLNQALIELGALVCTSKSPRCTDCPLRTACVAERDDLQGEIPAKKRKQKRSVMEMTSVVVSQRTAVLMEKQPESGLFAGLWCLPTLEGTLSPDAVIDEAQRKYGLALDRVFERADLKHVLTHRDIHMRVVSASCEPRKHENATQLAPIELAQLDTIGIPTITVRALEVGLDETLRRRAKLVSRNRPPRDEAL